MDLSAILTKYSGLPFVLYGGNKKILELLQSKGNVIVWFTTKSDIESTPKKQKYNEFLNVIYNAIYVIVGKNAANLPVEYVVSTILYNEGNTHKKLIIHEYPDLIIDALNVSKSLYDQGCVIIPNDPRVDALQRLNKLIRPEETLNIPIPLLSIESIPNVDTLTPYLHLESRISEYMSSSLKQIPVTKDQPVDIIDIYDTTKHMKYEDTVGTSAINWGQRKLLLSEIEMMVNIIKHDVDMGGTGKGFTLLYVGAAPGSHIPYLQSLFAEYDINVHTWDRKERFDPIESDDIKIVPKEFEDPETIGKDTEGFFTDYVAEKYLSKYGTNNKLVIISDIRDSPDEESVDRDMRMQEGWVQKIKPFASFLKFRLPYSKSKEYEYLSGDIYSQAWSRNRSAETRLLSFRFKGKFETKLYNTEYYDSTMAYFNYMTRMQSYDMGNIVMDITGKKTDVKRYIPVYEHGLCTCHDCAREVQIISKYLNLTGEDPTEETIRQIVITNTENSRPFIANKAEEPETKNTRTLWSFVSVKIAPQDRVNYILFKNVEDNYSDYSKMATDMWNSKGNKVGLNVSKSSIYDINIPNANKILMYTDELDPEEAVSLLSKETPYIKSTKSKIEIYRDVLKGIRYPVVINLHKDFNKKYSATDDRGQFGIRAFNRIIQNMKLAKSNSHDIDLWGHIILFILQN